MIDQGTKRIMKTYLQTAMQLLRNTQTMKILIALTFEIEWSRLDISQLTLSDQIILFEPIHAATHLRLALQSARNLTIKRMYANPQFWQS